jgi:hypothetical protein
MVKEREFSANEALEVSLAMSSTVVADLNGERTAPNIKRDCTSPTATVDGKDHIGSWLFKKGNV